MGIGAGPVLVGGPRPSAVAGAVAIIVPGGGTAVTVRVVVGCGVGSGSGLVAAQLDGDVGEGETGVVAGLSLATVSPQPVVHSAPVGDSEGHTVSDVVGHLGVGAAIAGHVDGVSTLGHGGREVAELIA